MKGHIEQRQTKKKLPRGHHCWSIIIETGRGLSGARGRKRYTFFGTKTEAGTELTKKLHQLETGSLVVNDRYTVAQYLSSPCVHQRVQPDAGAFRSPKRP